MKKERGLFREGFGVVETGECSKVLIGWSKVLFRVGRLNYPLWDGLIDKNRLLGFIMLNEVKGKMPSDEQSGQYIDNNLVVNY